MADARPDEVLSALDALSEAIERNREDEQLLLSRLANLRRAWAEGGVVGGALAQEPVPGTLQLLGRILSRLTESSGNARRALARAMRAEGATIPAIAQVFGVTHQRVSNILSRPVPAPEAGEGEKSAFGHQATGSEPLSDASARRSEQQMLG